ncbi:MAG: hypothetical protein GX660_06255 [Clostridiaceae bacterium]|nr:hypothetical protein [Clostridiaceae bacterium]
MQNNELASIRYSQVEAFRSSGQTASEWCTENDISIATLRYWITKLNRKNKQEQQGFIAFSSADSEPSTIVVRIGNYEIEVKAGFDTTTFRETVLILKNL